MLLMSSDINFGFLRNVHDYFFAFPLVATDCCLNQAGTREGHRKGMEFCKPVWKL